MSGTTTTVGFDGLFLDQTTTGVGMYVNHLWRTFQSTPEETPAMRLLMPGDHDVSPEFAANAVSIDPPSLFRSGKVSKLWWEQRGIAQASRSAGVQAVHIPYFAAPRFGSIPLIVTIHDVIPFVFPAYRNSFSMRMYLRLVSDAAKQAAAVLTDSECSKRDIERYLGIDRAKITVVPLAVEDRYRPDKNPQMEEELRSRLGLPGPVIFNVGGLDVRKNVPALIEAFAQALPDLDAGTRLVIAGHAHTGNQRLYPPLEPLIRKLGVEKYVVLPGRISEDEKVQLYNLAELYVFTSLYEGFGLSPLEAMACGTPVICSDRSSLPEVVGEGGILVDPVPATIASAISTTMNDPYMRRRLSQQGLEQAARFSWQRTAELTRGVYRQVLGIQ